VEFEVALCVTVLAVIAHAPTAIAQGIPPPVFVLAKVAGDSQTARTGGVFPQRLAVRLTDLDGKPLPGARIYFGNEYCDYFTGSFYCEIPGEPGHFASGSGSAAAITDATGIATAPPYYAGDGAGAIGVYAYVAQGEAPYFYTVSEVLFYMVSFRLNQVDATAVPVDAASWISLAALGTLLVAAAGACPRSQRPRA
jgi:hypothetical protein